MRMSRVLWLLVCVSCMAPVGLLRAAGTLQDDATLLGGLVSYWPLDEVPDVGRDMHGTNNLVASGTIDTVAGIHAEAVIFDKSDQQSLSVPTNAGISNGSVSWSVWVKLGSDVGDEAEVFVSKGDEATGVEYSIRYDLENGSGKLTFYRAMPGVGSNQVVYSGNLGTSAWHHLVMTYNGVVLDGYLDGVFVGSDGSSGNASLFYPSNISIGARWIPFLETAYVTGDIDEVGLWNRALTQEEVTRLYNSGLGLPYEATVTPPPPSATSSVAFFPGIMASRLYKPRALGEDRVWESTKRSDVLDIDMNEDGTSMRSDIYTRDAMDAAFKLTGSWSLGGEVYAGFNTYMNGLVDGGVIHAWKTLPYDWRLALEVLRTQGTHDAVTGNVSYLESSTTPYLAQELTRLANESPSGKVTIIAHSNGGLVAKYLLKKLEETNDPLYAKIDKLILVGSPQLGTPKAIGELLHGTIPVIGSVVREVSENMPGAYQLIPSQEYFTRAQRPLVTFDPSVSTLTPIASLAGEKVDTYSEMQKLFAGWNGTWSEPAESDTKTPNVLDNTLLAAAQNYHTYLDDWVPSGDVKMVQIAGTGVDTPDGVLYFEYCAMKGCPPEVTSRALSHAYLHSRRGDGTVLAGTANAQTAATNYFVELDEYNRVHDENRKHLDILSADPVQKLITQELLQHTSILPDYVTEEEQAPSTVVRYRFRVYSPVDIHVYDAAGRHTGVTQKTDGALGRTFEEKAPNSYYLEWDEGKYAGIDGESGPVRVQLQGSGYGTFRLEIDRVQGDVLKHTSVFDRIPTTPQASGTIHVLPTGSSTLLYDIDGNGSIDARIVAGTPARAIPLTLYFSSVREKVRTSSIPAWLKVWITARLVLAEKALQYGKYEKSTEAQAILKTVQVTLKQHTPRYISTKDSEVLTKQVQSLLSQLTLVYPSRTPSRDKKEGESHRD
jgi:pimeloyl-ACP methyl ester carboxylesterase